MIKQLSALLNNFLVSFPDLPKSGPWKCPKCSYIGNDPRALRVHYGVRHKIVLNHLATRYEQDHF